MTPCHCVFTFFSAPFCFRLAVAPALSLPCFLLASEYETLVSFSLHTGSSYVSCFRGGGGNTGTQPPFVLLLHLLRHSASFLTTVIRHELGVTTVIARSRKKGRRATLYYR